MSWENFKDWKTTGPFIVGALSLTVALAPQYGVHIPNWLQLASAVLAGLGIAGGGINATSKK